MELESDKVFSQKICLVSKNRTLYFLYPCSLLNEKNYIKIIIAIYNGTLDFKSLLGSYFF